MSVLVKGMKMPKNCDNCPMLYEYRFCALTDDHAKSIGWKTEELRMPNCPLIELPDHGDLVDIDKMLDDFAELRDYDFASREYVVIPAERSEE